MDYNFQPIFETERIIPENNSRGDQELKYAPKFSSGVFDKLKKSKFRASFKLSQKDRDIINQKGIETIKQHAKEILTNRVKIKKPNDGRQTPLKGYPVFIAQHATATCCRSCMKKWYNLPENKILSEKELDFFTELIIEWIKTNL